MRSPYRDSGFFVMRTPLLPFCAFVDWSRELSSPTAAPTAHETTLAIDRALLRERLARWLDDPAVWEAILLASPSLAQSLPVWKAEPDSEHGQKIERSLTRYFSRLCSRSTPFGLFAGCSLGVVGSDSCLQVAPRARYQRRTRFDNDYLWGLCDGLIKDRERRARLLFRPNTSLYFAGGRWRYAEGREQAGQRTYRAVAVEPSVHLEHVLDLSREGATLASLARAIVEIDAEITHDDAAAFLDELVDSQVLVADLLPPVTGPEPLDSLLRILHDIEAHSAVTSRLVRMRDMLADLDDGGVGQGAERYEAIAAALEPLPAKIDRARLVQVDMLKPGELRLGPKVMRQLSEAIDLLARISDPPDEDDLSKFRRDFIARYDQREVPLVEALDREVGIGFGGSSGDANPLIEGLALQRADEAGAMVSRRSAYLLHLASTCLASGRRELHLTDADLRALTVTQPRPLPTGFHVMATVAAPSSAALDAGDFQLFVDHASGPPGARMLGRFSHMPGIGDAVREQARAEAHARPDAIFAEVVHLPMGRMGNVVLRPVLRDHEIPWLGRSGASPSGQLLVSDLWVSVREGRVRLTSRRLGVEVLPRMSTAHNFSRGLPLYRFLCTLQIQGVAHWLRWTWGAADSLAFLPRVRRGRLVLSRARWRLQVGELKHLSQVDAAERWRRARAWQRAHGLPRLVELVEGEQELVIDFDNPLSVESLLGFAGRSEIILRELFPDEEELVAQGPEGLFRHEMFIPYTSRPAAIPSQRPAPSAGESRRSFLPGSEWLYVKLYTGRSLADALLRETLRPLVARVLKRRLARKWFFIRFGDPDWHLRLRFFGKPRALLGEVLPMLHKALAERLEERHLWRMEIGTYERELERYGGAQAMALTESVFCADSDAVLALLELCDGDEKAELRWRLGLVGVDRLLSDFQLSLTDRWRLMKSARQASQAEQGATAAARRTMSERFRAERRGLEQLMVGVAPSAEWTTGFAVFEERSRRVAPIVRAIRRTVGPLAGTAAEGIVASHVHMHLNRLLRAEARKQEMVLYDYLFRAYDGQLARQRIGASGGDGQ